MTLYETRRDNIYNIYNIYNNLDSRFSYFHIADKEECLPDCEDALKYINIKYLNKASQWCILNRKHAILIVNGANYYKNAYSCRTLNYLVWFTLSLIAYLIPSKRIELVKFCSNTIMANFAYENIV